MRSSVTLGKEDAMTHIPENGERKLPDRPLECSECKRPIEVVYTEVVGPHMTQTSHCLECPILNRKLHGIRKDTLGGSLTGTAGLCCGNCGTTFDAIQMGNPLGCTTCYDVFADVIVTDMLAANKISPQVNAGKTSQPLHIGRAPGEALEIAPSQRLLSLNEALNETLSREDYEQAAWLRDQIKALTEKSQEKKDEGKGQK